jgi:predicted RNA-binding protein with PIN domain
MRYLIDGHNLIAFTPGINLEMIDDEDQLINLLQKYQRQSRDHVEVYFDNSPPGQAGTHRYGMLTAHFIRAGLSADSAIRRRLVKLGPDARNWTVVSSDQAVQAAAREVHAAVIRSDVFAQKMLVAQEANQQSDRLNKGHRSDVDIDQDDIEEWLEIFLRKKE